MGTISHTQGLNKKLAVFEHFLIRLTRNLYRAIHELCEEKYALQHLLINLRPKVREGRNIELIPVWAIVIKP